MFLKNLYTYAPFTLLHFCTKTEEKNIRFCETVHTTPHKKRRFSKTLFEVDFTKTEVFENAVDQCERTKTDRSKKRYNNNKKILHTFLAKFNVEFEESKNVLDGIYKVLPVFLIKLLATINFKTEINVKALAPL